MSIVYSDREQTSQLEAVEEAVCKQPIVPTTKEEALAMRGVGWDGDLDEMRDGSVAGRDATPYGA